MNENTKLPENDFRSVLPRFTPEAMKANQALVDLLKQIGERKKATRRRSRLPGCWRRNPGSSPYRERPSSAVWKNLKAADVELTGDDLNEIEKAGAAIKIEGERYPPHLMATTGR